jgi:hypothetical protein
VVRTTRRAARLTAVAVWAASATGCGWTGRLSQTGPASSTGSSLPGIAASVVSGGAVNTQIGCLSAGSSSPAPPTAAASARSAPDPASTVPATAQPGLAAGNAAVWAEIQHELSTYRFSDYQHETTVDQLGGTYIVDCSGWGDVLLRLADCPAYADLAGAANSTRHTSFDPSCRLGPGPIDHGPYATDWATVLSGLAPGAGTAHWTRIATVAEVRPGDVVTYALGPGAADTGHVMFVAGMPSVDPGNVGQWRVPVADSTANEHGPDDSRSGNTRNSGGTGIGSSAIELIVDASGAPTNRLRWYPGASQVDQLPAPVLLGRLR